MDALSAASDEVSVLVPDHTALAPRPKRVADTGLSATLLTDLLAKHLLAAGTLAMTDLVVRLRLPARVLEELLNGMRQEACVEVQGNADGVGAVRFALTHFGRSVATQALSVSGYTGPAPVPLTQYASVVRAQTVHRRRVTSDDVHRAFHDVEMYESLMDRIGPSLNSGRAIFLYGPAGTGKTYVAQRLARVFREPVLVPHAVAIGDAVVSLFDPIMHKAIDRHADRGISLEGRHDERYIECERPAVIVGGELTQDMLDVHYDVHAREYRAPLQLKANNGVFVIDDMGRQRVSPKAVFNRWIVPLEEKVDYLSLGAGRHFASPFDMVLVFSTNLSPADLADEAFLRRIGYKIRLPHLDPNQYRRVWKDRCQTLGIPFDADVLEYALKDLHGRRGVPLLPCHPRDLLGLGMDRAIYTSQPKYITREILDWAWENYFVQTHRAEDRSPETGDIS